MTYICTSVYYLILLVYTPICRGGGESHTTRVGMVCSRKNKTELTSVNRKFSLHDGRERQL